MKLLIMRLINIYKKEKNTKKIRLIRISDKSKTITSKIK